MELQLIYGRAGSGNGEKIFDLTAENDGLLIVPETYTLIAEKHLAEKCGSLGLSGAEVLSFLRLAHSLSDFGPFGGASIDPVGKTMALAMISDSLRSSLSILKGSSTRPGFSESMLKLISEFKRYNVTADDIKNAAQNAKTKIFASKLSDIGAIYQKYCEFLDSGYTDRDDDLERLCIALENKKLFLGKCVYIDRFTSFTPSEYSVISVLLKQCHSVTVSLPCEPGSLQFQFMSAEATGERLKELAENSGIEIKPDIVLKTKKSGELLHLEENYFSFEPKTYEDKTEALSIFTAKSLYSEIEYVARKILELVRSGASFSDISVISREGEIYLPTIKSIFGKAEIPFTATESLSVASHSLALYIISAVDTVTSCYSYDSLFRYLKSGFSGISAEATDRLENYILASGIKGYQFESDERWNYRTASFSMRSPSESEAKLLDELHLIRKQILSPLSVLKQKITGKISALQFCTAIYEFMEGTGLEGKINALCEQYEKDGNTDEGARLISVYNRFISSMDALVSSCGDDKHTASKYNRFLSDGLSAAKMSIIPSSLDCVNILTAPRAKGSTYPIVFLIGLNEGVFPATPSSSGLLSDSDRHELALLNIELSPDIEHLNYEELSLLYNTINCAENRIYFSYPIKSSSGESLYPSIVISTLHKLFLNISEQDDLLPLPAASLVSAPGITVTHMLDALNRLAYNKEADKDWLKVYGWWLEHSELFLPHIPNSLQSMKIVENLPADITKKLFPDGFTTSISRLESYSACPFSYYMNYILKAAPRKIADISPSDTGSILHYYLERVGRQISNSDITWQTVSDEQLRTLAHDATDTVISEGSYFLKSSSRALYHIKRLEILSYKMLLTIKKHFTLGQFEPLGCEIVFGKNGDYPEIEIATPTGNVHLTGKIDRADILHTQNGDFIRIIDYKSGNKSFDFSEVYYGFNMQLSIYMLAMNENTGANPAGMLYFHLDDPIEKSDLPEDFSKAYANREKSLKMSGLLLNDDVVLSAMGDSYCDKPELATLENFSQLFTHMKKTVSKIVFEMQSGNIAATPRELNNSSPCEYCDFGDACANIHNTQKLQKIDKDVWSAFAKGDEDK